MRTILRRPSLMYIDMSIREFETAISSNCSVLLTTSSSGVNVTATVTLELAIVTIMQNDTAISVDRRPNANRTKIPDYRYVKNEAPNPREILRAVHEFPHVGEEKVQIKGVTPSWSPLSSSGYP